MRKFLLIACATLSFGMANAQSLNAKKDAGKPIMGRTHQVSKQTQMAAPKQLQPMKAKHSKRPVLLTGQEQSFNGKKVVSFKGNRFSVAAPRKIGQFASLYNGSAVNYRTSEVERFQMQPVTLTDERTGEEVPGLQNIIPSPFTNSDVEVTYYQDAAGKVEVIAQWLGTVEFTDGSVYEVFIENFTQGADKFGTINFTLDDEGNFTCETAYVAYTLYPEGQRDFVQDGFEAWWMVYSNIKYVPEGKEVAPDVYYDTDDAIYHTGIAPNGYNFIVGHTLAPAYAPISFINYTTDPVDSWQWNVSIADFDEAESQYIDGETYATGSEANFSFTTEGNELYANPWVVASTGRASSEPVKYLDEGSGIYAGYTTDEWEFDDGERPSLSRANLKYGLTILEDINEETGIKSYIFYQGKPAAPLYFEGVDLLIYQFAQVKENLDLKAKLQKVTRDPRSGELEMGEVIAEADVDPVAYFPSSPWNNTARLSFSNFAIVDEWGFKIDLDHVFVEDEFAIVIEGFDNVTFTGNVLCDGGADGGVTNTYVALSGEDYKGSAYWRFYGHAFAGLINAAYGYLYTEDDTNVNLPVEGGQAAINIHPMLCSVNDSNQPTTRLFLDDESEEIPDWLQVGFANEDYDEAFVFDLVFEAEPLPAGVESREVELIFFQEGARLRVKVSQGDNGNQGVQVVKTLNNYQGQTFDLSGRQAAAGKGILVRNGKKVIVK